MEDLTQRSVDEFLNAVAQRTPTPGGGSVAALAGASACALARMIAAYSTGSQTNPRDGGVTQGLLDRLRGADEILRGLVTHDAVAFEAMSAMAKGSRLKSPQEPERHEATLAAVAAPMEAAAALSHALTALDQMKDTVNRRLLSDLGAAAVLAEAAAKAARYMVLVNLPELNDAATQAKLRSSIDETLKHCRAHRRSIEAFLRRQQMPTGGGASNRGGAGGQRRRSQGSW